MKNKDDAGADHRRHALRLDPVCASIEFKALSLRQRWPSVELGKVAVDEVKPVDRNLTLDVPMGPGPVPVVAVDPARQQVPRFQGCLAGGCIGPFPECGLHEAPDLGWPAHDGEPVVYIIFDEAQVYCQWAGKRLPVKAEWIEAAYTERCPVLFTPFEAGRNLEEEGGMHTGKQGNAEVKLGNRGAQRNV